VRFLWRPPTNPSATGSNISTTLIEAHFDATLADLGLSRRHWQVLNLLSETARTRTELEQSLAPFWQDPAAELEVGLRGPDGLLTRGWVGDDQSDLALTGQGRAVLREAATRVAEIRRRLVDGLTAQQYAETVQILSVMAGNVEAAMAERPSNEDRGSVLAGELIFP